MVVAFSFSRVSTRSKRRVEAHVNRVETAQKVPKMNAIMYWFQHKSVTRYLINNRFIYSWLYNLNRSDNIFLKCTFLLLICKRYIISWTTSFHEFVVIKNRSFEGARHFCVSSLFKLIVWARWLLLLKHFYLWPKKEALIDFSNIIVWQLNRLLTQS